VPGGGTKAKKQNCRSTALDCTPRQVRHWAAVTQQPTSFGLNKKREAARSHWAATPAHLHVKVHAKQPLHELMYKACAALLGSLRTQTPRSRDRVRAFCSSVAQKKESTWTASRGHITWHAQQQHKISKRRLAASLAAAWPRRLTTPLPPDRSVAHCLSLLRGPQQMPDSRLTLNSNLPALCIYPPGLQTSLPPYLG